MVKVTRNIKVPKTIQGFYYYGLYCFLQKVGKLTFNGYCVTDINSLIKFLLLNNLGSKWVLIEFCKASIILR